VSKLKQTKYHWTPPIKKLRIQYYPGNDQGTGWLPEFVEGPAGEKS